MKQCPNCGADAQDGWILCPSCGIDMRKAAERLGRDHYISPGSEPVFNNQVPVPQQEIVTQPQSSKAHSLRVDMVEQSNSVYDTDSDQGLEYKHNTERTPHYDDAGMKQCPNCGAEVQEEWIFCPSPSCRMNLRPVPDSTASPALGIWMYVAVASGFLSLFGLAAGDNLFAGGMFLICIVAAFEAWKGWGWK